MTANYSELNLHTNPIINFGLELFATTLAFPATGTEGQQIFCQADSLIYYWDGTQWVAQDDTTYTGTAPIQISPTDVITIDAATQTTAGSLSAADKKLLDEATNLATANTLVERDASGNAEVAYPTANSHIATKKYVDDVITELGEFVGGWDASAGLPTAGSGGAGEIDANDYWYATVAGTIAGLAPQTDVEIGDVLVATIDSATAATDFIVMQRNMDVDTTVYTQRYEEIYTFANGTYYTVQHDLGAVPVVNLYRQTDGRKVNARIRENAADPTKALDIRFSGIGAGLSVRVVCVG